MKAFDLNNQLVITDGAMGTYFFEQMQGEQVICELANLTQPEVISSIHKAYIKAGANFIRTNTFAANTVSLNSTREQVRQVIETGYQIACEAAKQKGVIVAASIGPIRQPVDSVDNIQDEYLWIVDTFLNMGARVFVFETFSSMLHLKEISEHIKAYDAEIDVFCHFALMPDGFTREGVSLKQICASMQATSSIDYYGFNCGSGPTHLYELFKEMTLDEKLVSIIPNSGYPQVVGERTVYPNNPTYFADKMLPFRALGFKMIGGCCGTSPSHIQQLSSRVSNPIQVVPRVAEQKKYTQTVCNKVQNSFYDKLQKGDFVIATELSPPFDIQMESMLACACAYREAGVDLVTIPDSPMSRVRADSGVIAAKIKREIGIDAMPHMCCRDKNTNAIRSGLLASHIEGLRNILAITGDPVSDANKQDTKSVFNLNAYKLIELIKAANEELFSHEPFAIGGALNLNAAHKEKEVQRMLKKVECGATFFLTQPIYEETALEALKQIKEDYPHIKILGGVLPIVSYRNAQFLNNELPGVHIPEQILSRFTSEMDRETAEQTGIEIAVELVRQMKPYVDGLYMITPFKRVEMIIQICKQAI